MRIQKTMLYIVMIISVILIPTMLLLFVLNIWFGIGSLLFVVFGYRFIAKTEDIVNKENRNLLSRLRYRVHHTTMEVQKFSTVSQAFNPYNKTIAKVLRSSKYSSRERFKLVASIDEHPFEYKEVRIIQKNQLNNKRVFEGVSVSFKSRIAEIEDVFINHEEVLHYYDKGYVVVENGLITLYLECDQPIHDILKYQEKIDIKEQILMVRSHVVKAMKIRNEIEKILLEEYTIGGSK